MLHKASPDANLLPRPMSMSSKKYHYHLHDLPRHFSRHATHFLPPPHPRFPLPHLHHCPKYLQLRSTIKSACTVHIGVWPKLTSALPGPILTAGSGAGS